MTSAPSFSRSHRSNELFSRTRTDEVLARYRNIDREVYATLAQDEAELMRS